MEKLIERPHAASATLTGVLTYVAWCFLTGHSLHVEAVLLLTDISHVRF